MTAHNDPDHIRSDIARTRAGLSHDVDTLTETANPKNIAGRQADRVKGAARSVRDHVMGEPDDPYDSGTLGDTADELKRRGATAADTVTDAPQRIRQRARGNPLAAGLIAFGIGYLISSAIPSSQREQQAAERLQEKAEPLKEQLTEAAQEVGDRLREPAKEAAESVKASAGGAVDTVKQEGQIAKDEVTDEVRSAQQRQGGATPL
jgi:hypothetical protein